MLSSAVRSGFSIDPGMLEKKVESIMEPVKVQMKEDTRGSLDGINITRFESGSVHEGTSRNAILLLNSFISRGLADLYEEPDPEPDPGPEEKQITKPLNKQMTKPSNKRR